MKSIPTTALLALACFAPVPGLAQAPQPEVVRMVGFTAARANGVGMIGFNRMCHAEFPGTRMCTSQEAQQSVNPPAPADGEPAWVHPTFLFATRNKNGAPRYLRFGGATASNPKALTCGGAWEAAEGGTGLALVSSGPDRVVLSPLSCDVQRSVACCRPVVGGR